VGLGNNSHFQHRVVDTPLKYGCFFQAYFVLPSFIFLTGLCEVAFLI